MNTIKLNTIGILSGGGNAEKTEKLPNDGNTYIELNIPDIKERTVQIYYKQDYAGGSTIDWGDKSVEILDKANATTSSEKIHHYASPGTYIIKIQVNEDNTLYLGSGISNGSFMGNYTRGAVRSFPRNIVIGRNIKLYKTAFYNLPFLSSIQFFQPSMVDVLESYCMSNAGIGELSLPDSITSLGERCFQGNITKLVINKNLQSTGPSICYSCQFLSEVIFEGDTDIATGAFYGAAYIRVISFKNATRVPSLANVQAIGGDSETKIIIPDSLYDEWGSATNWSSIKSRLVKKSEWDTLNA